MAEPERLKGEVFPVLSLLLHVTYYSRTRFHNILNNNTHLPTRAYGVQNASRCTGVICFHIHLILHLPRLQCLKLITIMPSEELYEAYVVRLKTRSECERGVLSQPPWDIQDGLFCLLACFVR